MWNPKKVEQALFSWRPWLKSILNQWAQGEEEFIGLTYDEVRDRTHQALATMDFPASIWLEIYWVCCAVSDYSIDYQVSYDNIVMPGWLIEKAGPYLESYEIESGMRCYPPEIWNEKDIDFYARQIFGRKLPDKSILYPSERELRIVLPSGHEFYMVLNKFKGRPSRSGRRGKRPRYSDRMAVRCAVLKDKRGMTFVEIAGEFGLPTSKPYDSRQSDVARQLVDKGRKIIRKPEDST